MESPEVEEKELIRFERSQEYFALLHQFLPQISSDPKSNPSKVTSQDDSNSQQASSTLSREALMTKMGEILDEYQEQSYLLDPHLEDMVHPPVRSLQSFVRKFQAGTTTTLDPQALLDQEKIAELIYLYTKVRGYKTITRFFPHEVADLLPVLTFLESLSTSEEAESDSKSSWELRYVLLLWLSLVCMIPFDLQKFDDSTKSSEGQTTSQRIEKVGRRFLESPGKERDASSVMLGKLFQRKDASEAQFGGFLSWCHSESSGKPSVFLASGILQTLCEIVKLSPPSSIEHRLPAIQAILDLYNDQETSDSAIYDSSSISRYQTKLACRLGLKLLKPRRVTGRRVKMLGNPTVEVALSGAGSSGDQIGIEGDDDDEDVPEEIEGYISKLLEGLQHKDTQIRYLSAKSLARLSERLPRAFISQIADAITALFSINLFDVLGKKADLSAVSEFTWQGACLGVAELGRRGLLEDDEFGSLAEKLEWVEKALHFDVRRGSHSVGSGVRDSACYVLWAISRTMSADSPTLKSHALSLARSLISVALLDREISIRRAASAAFQECVGRLSLFPHGIDLIRKTDFYAISVRKNSFLECTREVAVHEEYRESLLDHILETTILHWDSSMRELGSQAAARVIELDLKTLGPKSLKLLESNCNSRDSNVLHGSLLTLSEVAKVAGSVREVELQIKCFQALEPVPPTSLRVMGAAQVLLAACQLISSSVSSAALGTSSPSNASDPSQIPQWEKIINTALSRSEEEVQIAASVALGAVSSHLDFIPRLKETIKDWKGFSPSQQQSNALALGRLDYHTKHEGLSISLRFLLGLVESKSPSYSKNIETRRNAYDSIASSLSSVGDSLFNVIDVPLAHAIQSALLLGLEDYSTDQRGDVGSWVRLSCISGLSSLVSTFSRVHLKQDSQSELHQWLSQDVLINIIGGLMKQMVERIDNVRDAAGTNLLQTLKVIGETKEWKDVEGLGLFEQIFSANETTKFKDPNWLYPKAVQLLSLSSYRPLLLEGLVLVIGSRTEMAHRIVGASLCSFVIASSDKSSPGESEFNALELLQSLFSLASSNFSSNRLFVPALQAINLLLEGGVADEVDEVEGKTILSKILRMVTRNIEKVKSVQRVQVSMMISYNVLAIPYLKPEAIAHTATFLSHSFPTIRAAASEQLYLVLQSMDSDEIEAELNEDGLSPQDEIEELLLGTAWSSSRSDNFRPEAQRVKDLLSQTSSL